MWLIIATLLFVGFIIRLSFDNFTTNVAKACLDNKLNKHEEWIEKYTNIKLESVISKFMDNPDNQKAIWKEVSAALKQMPHWAPEYEWKFNIGSANQNLDLVLFHRSVANDILLANRGKIAHLGDKRYVNFQSGDNKTKYRDYELAEWIQKTLAKQNIYLKLYYRKDPPYEIVFWEGTLDYINNINELRELDRSLLLSVTKIPKPYYEQ